MSPNVLLVWLVGIISQWIYYLTFCKYSEGLPSIPASKRLPIHGIPLSIAHDIKLLSPTMHWDSFLAGTLFHLTWSLQTHSTATNARKMEGYVMWQSTKPNNHQQELEPHHHHHEISLYLVFLDFLRIFDFSWMEYYTNHLSIKWKIVYNDKKNIKSILY